MMVTDPQWYYVFYQCALYGSFSAAAKALYVSQSAVSQTIGKLEQSLGGPLFVRTARGVLLTGEGAALYAHVSRAFLNLRAGEAEIRRRMALEEGNLRIGTSDAILRYFLLPVLTNLGIRYPGISLTLTNNTTPRTLAQLNENTVDICLVHLPVPDADRYEIIPYRSLHDCLICGAKYRELSKQTRKLEELQGYPWIMLDQESMTRRILDEQLHRLHIDLVPDFVTGSIDSLLDIAAQGLGLAIVAREYAATRMKTGDILPIPIDREFSPRRIGIITRRDSPLSRAESAFISILTETDSRSGSDKD